MPPEGFTHRLYQQEVAGKPRMSGARAALEHFGVPDVEAMAAVYADRKQRRIVELIAAGEFTAFPDALRFVLAVRAAGIAIATASSSKNAALFLRAIRLDTFADEQGLDHDFVRPGLTLLDFVDAEISGRDFARGKPHPEIFLTAAAGLGLEPRECFVVEDAAAGIAAAVAGGMAALGVARRRGGAASGGRRGPGRDDARRGRRRRPRAGPAGGHAGARRASARPDGRRRAPAAIGANCAVKCRSAGGSDTIR